MSAEELLKAQVAAADQAALTKAFNAAKRDDVKGLMKAQKEGRTYEYMEKWIPPDVKRRLSEERKKAPKLRPRRVNRAGNRAPQKQAAKSGGRRNDGTSPVELSEASLLAFLANEKTGKLSPAQALARDSASQVSPYSMDGNTKKQQRTLVENKLPCQNRTNSKISSSKSSAKEAPMVRATPSLLNDRENIHPTSIRSGAKGNNATTSLSSTKTNLKPIRNEKNSITRDPLSSLKARRTDQNNRNVASTSNEWSGSKEVTETRTNLRKVDKSSPYLSSTPSNTKEAKAVDPTSVTDGDDGKYPSFIGGVKLRPVKSVKELSPVRSSGPKTSPQSFSQSTGASSIPGKDKKNVRCGAVSRSKNFEAVASPVKKKEIVSSPSISSPHLKTSVEEVEATVVPPLTSFEKKEVKSKNFEAVASLVKKKEIVSSPIISSLPLKTSVEEVEATVVPPLISSFEKKEVKSKNFEAVASPKKKEIVSSPSISSLPLKTSVEEVEATVVPPLTSFEKKEVKSKNFEAVASPVKKKEIVSSPSISSLPLKTSVEEVEATVVPPLTSFKKDSSASIEKSPIGDDGSKELEMAKYKTSIQDDTTPRVKLSPLTSTPLAQDHMPISSTKVKNTNELLENKLKVTEIIPGIEDSAAEEQLLTPLLQTKAEKDKTPSASTTLNISEPIEGLEVTECTTNMEENVVVTIDPKFTAAPLSMSENIDNTEIENKKEMRTTKLGRLSAFFGRLLRFGKQKKVPPSAERDEISNPSTNTNSSAAQDSSSQENDTVVETKCTTDIANTMEQTPSIEITTHNASGSLKSGKKRKKTAKRRKSTVDNESETASGVVPHTTETGSSSKSRKRMWLFGGKKAAKQSAKKRKVKLMCSEDIGSITATTELRDGEMTTTTNDEEDPSAIPFADAPHDASLHSKKKKKISVFNRSDKRRKVLKIREEGGSAGCCSTNENSTTATTDVTTSDIQLSSSKATITKAASSKLIGKQNDLKMKRGKGRENQSSVKPIAKKAVAPATNVPLPVDTAENTSSACIVFSSESTSAATTTLKSKKKRKMKQNVKKSSKIKKRTPTIQQLSSSKLASIAENALSKFLGEAKPKTITAQERIAREQAAFERTQQQHKAFLLLPPVGLLGLRHMKVASPQASVQKDSAMALNRQSFRRRVGIERRASKHHCITEMFCEVHVRMWYGHEDDASSSVWATQYAFLKLTEGVLWMGKAGAVMKEVALISKTCTFSHIQYVEDEDGKECVLVIIDDSGSCNGSKRYIQLCARTTEETNEFHQLLCLSNGC